MAKRDNELESLFQAALEKEPGPPRQAFLAEHCSHDPEIRRQIESLLMANAEMGSQFLRQTLEPTLPPSETDESGNRIGPYKLLQQIGEGGMGVVYLAEQKQPVKRRVALKIIKAGMDSKQVIARFEAERQALAMMDHPNIARVLDGGMTEQGRPYFAMEYVKGVPLTKYCDDAKLSVRERLELFLPICMAVQHAHQKGIIHRDLKPANILVCAYDGKPVPKVIDFGLAKAMYQSLTDQTLFTAHGMVIGTPLYMSPEQAEQNNQDIDTRTDIYSLGVILYELLTGSTPLERNQLKQAAVNEIMRLIKDVDPPKPSTRLSSSENLPSVADQRSIEPSRLTRTVIGDLDCVVMKALEKERSRRYETANGFAEDLRRYLADEPVSATPPSNRYRMQKFIKRNRAGVIATGVIAVALGFACSGWIWLQQQQADRKFMTMQKVNEMLEEAQLHQQLAKAAQGEEKSSLDLKVRKLTQARSRAQDAMDLAKTENIDSEFVGTVADLLAELNQETDQARKLSAEVAADRDFQKQLDSIRLVQAGGANAEWSNLQFSDRNQNKLQGRTGERAFDIYLASGLYEQVLRSHGINVSTLPIEEVVSIVRQSRIRENLIIALDDWLRALPAGPEKGGETNLPTALEDRNTRSKLLAILHQSDDNQWRKRLRDALIARDLNRLKEMAASDETKIQPPVLIAWLGGVLRDSNAFHDSIGVLTQACSQHPADFWLNFELAQSFSRIAQTKSGRGGEAAEGVGYARAALSLRPQSSGAWWGLAVCLRLAKRFDEAVSTYRTAIELDSQNTDALRGLGTAYFQQGNMDEALSCVHASIEIDPNNSELYCMLADFLAEQGKIEEAVAEYRRAIQLAPRPEYAARYHVNLGAKFDKHGKQNEAIQEYHKATKLAPMWAHPHYVLGLSLARQGKLNEALSLHRKAIELAPAQALPHFWLAKTYAVSGMRQETAAEYRKAIALDPTWAMPHYNLGMNLYDQAKLEEAIVEYRKAIDLDPEYASAYNNLGFTFRMLGRLNEALAAFRKCIELNPNGGIKHVNLGITLLKQCQLNGEWNETMVECRRVIALYGSLIDENSTDPNWFANRAIAHAHLRNWQAAYQDWKSAPLDKVTHLFWYYAGFRRMLSENDEFVLAANVEQDLTGKLENLIQHHPKAEAQADLLADILQEQIDVDKRVPMTVLPTSVETGIEWRYTTTSPTGDWMNPDFDDSSWNSGAAPFGNFDHRYPPRTQWDTSDLWLRKNFQWMPSEADSSLVLRIFHDNDATVFINGREVAAVSGTSRRYVDHVLDPDWFELKEGTNTLAMNCHQELGETGDDNVTVDAGLTTVPTTAWSRLAAAYHLLGQEEKLQRILAEHPDVTYALSKMFPDQSKW